MSPLRAIFRLLYICQDLLREALRFLRLLVSAKASLAAEVLFLRKQLAFYQERKIKPYRFDDSARLSMLVLAKLFDWKNALINVKPETFLGWHDKAFQLFWRWKSRGGRPRLPKDIRRLIVEMAVSNPTWGRSVWRTNSRLSWASWCHREPFAPTGLTIVIPGQDGSLDSAGRPLCETTRTFLSPATLPRW